MKFCIVTPSFNQAQFLEQTIQSVISQNGDFEVELFVADGGSTDGSKKILTKYADRIAFISEKDNGQTDAINKGIAYFAKSKQLDPQNTIFAYINSDDYFLPGILQQVAKRFMTDPQCHWLVGDAIIVDSTNNEIQRPVRLYKKFWRSVMSHFVLTVLNPLPQPSTFVRWSALQQVGPFNEQLRYVMDYEYWLRLYQAGYQPTWINQALSCFRIHGRSKGGSQFHKQFDEELDIAQRFTKNPLAISLHRLHNQLIRLVYSKVK